MVRAWLTVLLALAAAACDPGFETKSIVLDLRMLAIQADPPEVVVDFDPEMPVLPDLPPVTVRGLVADPAAERRLAWQLVACPPDNSSRCDGAPVVVAMGSGVADDPESQTGAVISAELVADLPLLQAAIEGDAQGGFSGVAVMVELRVWPEGDTIDDAIVGVKSVVYAPRIPAERTANVNPMVDVITDEAMAPIDGGRCADPAVDRRTIATNTAITLEPIEPAGVRETYVLPTLDGGARTITENLRYSWFATAGDFSSEQTGGPVDFFGNAPPLDSEWTAPDETGQVEIWMVVRDERGGTHWTQRCFDVLP